MSNLGETIEIHHLMGVEPAEIVGIFRHRADAGERPKVSVRFADRTFASAFYDYSTQEWSMR